MVTNQWKPPDIRISLERVVGGLTCLIGIAVWITISIDSDISRREGLATAVCIDQCRLDRTRTIRSTISG